MQGHSGHDASSIAQSQPLGFMLLPQTQWRPEVTHPAATQILSGVVWALATKLFCLSGTFPALRKLSTWMASVSCIANLR